MGNSDSRPASSGGKKFVPRLMGAEDDIRRDQVVMKDASRENYRYDQPEQELGMADLTKKHSRGDRFLYAAVTASQDEEDSSRLRRLIKFQPKLARKAIPVPDLPSLALFKEVETFQLQHLLPPRKDKLHTYINISEVLVVYGSLISSDSAFSKIKVSIIDNRLLGNKVAKSYIANTNVISKATMSLSYCFPRAEASQVNLSLSREAAFLEEGSQWGVAQVRIQMEETEFPTQSSNSTVQAINMLPQSMLEERPVNSDTIDISIMNNDRLRLRDMYMDGDLADETEPVINRMEAVKYAKSSLAGPKGKKTEKPMAEGWEHLSSLRQSGAHAGDNSVDPSEEGSIEEVERGDVELPKARRGSPPPLKSAMKKAKNVISFEDPNSIPVEVPDDVAFSDETITEDRKLQVISPNKVSFMDD